VIRYRALQSSAALVALALSLALALAVGATNLTGTFHKPDGTPVNGKLIFLLSQPAKLNDNSAQVVPMVKIFAVTNGQLEAGAFIYGNDVLVPAGTHYLVRLVDDGNNLLFEQKWSIQGTTLDLGTLTPTTTGVVLPDPLVKNVTTNQAVQGPVTFNAGVSAASLTVHGNLGPGAAGLYELGSAAAPWRELYAGAWAGRVHPGNASALATAPTAGPTLFQEATTGGSIADGTYYCKWTGVNLNGETTASPETSIVVSAGTGTVRLGTRFPGREWWTGFFAANLYCGTVMGGPYYQVTPYSRTFTADTDSVSRDANDFLTLTDTGTTTFGVADGATVTISGATGCTDNPNGTFQVYSHTAVSSPAAASITFKHAGATESGCGGAAITISFPTAIGLSAHPNAHYVLGDLLFNSVPGSGTQPPSTNTAAIDDVQVAVNASCDYSNTRCQKTVQLGLGNDTADDGTPQYNLTTPLILVEGKLKGHASTTLSSTTDGTRFACTSTQNAKWDTDGEKVGCIMVLNDSRGVLVEGVNVESASHGVYLLHTPGGAASGTQLYFQYGNWSTQGTKCVAPLKIRGTFYSIQFSNIEYRAASTVDCFATSGVPRSAAIMIEHPSGGQWLFTGQSRFTVPDRADTIQNRGGADDPDRGTGATGTAVLIFSDVGNFQYTGGTGTGIPCRCQNTQLYFNRVPGTADYSPDAGTDPAFILGANVDGSQAGALFESVNSSILGSSNNASLIKWIHNGGNMRFLNTTLGTPPTTIIDFNNLNVGLQAMNTQDSSNTGLCDPRQSYFANRVTATSSGNNAIQCLGNRRSANADGREGPHFYLQGGMVRQGWRATESEARLWGAWTPDGGTRYCVYKGDPDTAANKMWCEDVATGNVEFYGSDGTTIVAELDHTNNQWEFPRSTGTQPFSVTSTTAVANLNADRWDGKDGIDFSGALDFGSIAAQTCAALTITATGAQANDPVAPSWPAALEVGLAGIMHVTAANTVTVRLCNVTAGAIDPASQTFAGRVVR
jgi:hypothetical protein